MQNVKRYSSELEVCQLWQNIFKNKNKNNGCDVPKNNNKNIILQIALIVSQNEADGNIFITLVVYVKHMKKSEWLDCQRNEFFPKQKGIPSLVKIEHKNTATLDSARSKKKYLKSQFCN